MTKFERISLVTSSLALFVALLAAVISPWLTYRWFDTATKPFKERGTFIVVHSEVTEVQGGEKPLFTDAKIDIRNIGHNPAKDARIISVRSAANTPEPEIRVADRVTERTKTDGILTEYSFSQAVAPDDTITVTSHGPLTSLYIINEFGEKTVLIQPSPAWNLEN
jgi:hypothetical protein